MNKFPITAGLLLLAAANVHALKAPTQGLGNANIGASVGSFGAIPEILVKNISGNKQLAAVNLQAQNDSIALRLRGTGECAGEMFESAFTRLGEYYKTANIGVGKDTAYWSVNTGDHGDINVYQVDVTKDLNVPVSAFDGTPYAIDAAALVMSEANKLGGTARINYLRQPHTYQVQVPIHFDVQCRDFERKKVKKVTSFGATTTLSDYRMTPVRIRYVGDPAITGTPIAAANSPNTPKGLATSAQGPIKVNAGQFIEGQKTMTGKCPMEADFKVRLTGSGEGQVKIRINDGGNTVHQSSPVDFTQGKTEYAFSVKVGLNEKVLNKSYGHNYRIYVFARSEQDNSWPAFGQWVSGAPMIWSHTCTTSNTPKPSVSGPQGFKATTGTKSLPPRAR